MGEDEDQYEIIDKNIGAKRGSFAQIMLARAPGRGARVIMKCIPLKGSSKKCQLHALKEAEILQRLVHPHIVGFIDSFLYRGSLVIVQEWCERKDLRLLLVKKKYQKQYLQEETIRRGIFEIVKAVAYLHRKEFLHRDLKCANCFLTANNQMKIGDFGHACWMFADSKEHHLLSGSYKTKNNMAPEVCLGMPHVAASDIYQISLIAYEMAALSRPVYNENKLLEECAEPRRQESNVGGQSGATWNAALFAVPARIPEHYSDDLNALIMHMMDGEKLERPTAESLERHVFLAPPTARGKQHAGKQNKIKCAQDLRSAGAAEKMRYLKRQLEFLQW